MTAQNLHEESEGPSEQNCLWEQSLRQSQSLDTFCVLFAGHRAAIGALYQQMLFVV